MKKIGALAIMSLALALGTRAQSFSYGFTTVESPLSDSSQFSSLSGFTNLSVPSSGSVEPGSGDSGMYLNATYAADQYATVTLGSDGGGSSYFGPGVRFTSSLTGYMLVITPTTVYITKMTGGDNGTHLASASASPAGGQVWEISAAGSTITAYLNGTAVVSATDSTYGSGSPGFYESGSVSISAMTAGALSSGSMTFSYGPANFGYNTGSSPITIISSAPSTSGLFWVYWNQVTVGTGCSAASNTVALSANYIDENNQTVTRSLGSISMTGNGSLSGSNFGSYTQPILSKPGTAVTFGISSTLSSSGCGTIPQFELSGKLQY